MDDKTKTILLAGAVGGAVATLAHVALVYMTPAACRTTTTTKSTGASTTTTKSNGASTTSSTTKNRTNGKASLSRRMSRVTHPSSSRAEDGFGTTVIHAGQEPDAQTGAVVVPISLATTFAQAKPGDKKGEDMPSSFGNGWEYSRTGNPTRGTYERAVAATEGGRHCCAFSSGMAATSAILHLLETGDHVVCIDDVYGGTQRYFRRTAVPTYGMKFTFVDFNDAGALAEACATPRTKLLWLETPTNPTLKVSSIAAAAAAAEEVGALLVVDNTFASPFFQSPLAHGAHIVMHSATKYIGGHSDVVGGVVVTDDDDVIAKLRFIQNGVGAVPAPFDCYLALRGLKTLHVRMAQAMANASSISAWLERHPKVTKVLYPGLKSHPQHDLAMRQMHGPGAMITFYLRGGIEETTTFLAALKLFTLAESLGAVESLAEAPSVMTHASVPPEQRRILGIDDSLVRLSVGIESLEDLRADLEQALDQV